MSSASPPDASTLQHTPRAPLPAWKGVLFVLLAVGLFFGLIEGALTLLNLPPPIKVYNTRPDIFWGLEANLNAQGFLHKELGTTFEVTTNAQSLRYGAIPEGRQDKTLRVLTLGDSTTFGWGVPQAETWPAQLELLLQKAHPEVKLEVLNGGVPGYTSFQGLHHYKANGMKFQPDLVVFGYIVQDARATLITDRQQAIAALNADYVADHPLFRLRIARLLQQRYALFRSFQADQVASQGNKEGVTTTRVPLEDYQENIETFARLTREQGSQLLLFGMPLEVVGYTQAHRSLLKSLSETLKLPHFDPSETIAEEARQQVMYFPEDKGHPNALGCKRIAELFAADLEQGLLKTLITARQ